MQNALCTGRYLCRRRVTKTLLIMKLMAIFLFTALCQANAGVYGQRVSMTLKEAGLKTVFTEIQRQTGYHFLYNDEMLKDAGNVSVDLHDVPLKEALDVCLLGKVLTYTISSNTIVIRERPAKAIIVVLSDEAPPEDAVPVTGQVLGANGEPLAGATVKVKRTSLGTSTDGDGRFVLDVNPGDVLQITYTGYQLYEIKVGKTHNFTVKMMLMDAKLDEIQIVAYGQSSKRYNVGNVTVVKADDIAKNPASNVLQALDGRVPGLYIKQATGFSGSSFQVQIQGQSSMRSSTNPLYVIDGIPWISQLVGEGTASLGYNAGSPLAYINPNDVESITVLKDADATSIYGARAANGAILINTKRGKIGPATFDLSVRKGKNYVGFQGPVLNREQYLEMRREAKKNDNAPIYSTDYDLNGLWDTTRYTNWQKILSGGHGDYTELYGTLSGGTAAARYSVGMTYREQRPIVPGNFINRQGSLAFALNTASANQKFRTEITAKMTYDNNLVPVDEQSGSAVFFAPVTPPPYDSLGNLNFGNTPSGDWTFANPLRSFESKLKRVARSFQTGITLSYQIASGLDISTRFGYTYLNTYDFKTYPLTVLPPQYWPTSERGSSFGTGNYDTYNADPQLNYSTAIGAGKLSASVGFSVQTNLAKWSGIQGGGYTSDAAMRDITLAKSTFLLGTINTRTRSAGTFARVNYILANRYIADFSGRRDGTSKFSPANRFHNYAALGLGWIFSEEKFIKPLSKVLSFGKITTSYGSTGNDGIGDYQYMDMYYPLQTGLLYQNSLSLTPNGLFNPALQWESTIKLDFGLTVGLFKQRVNLDIHYYRNRIGNQLLGQPLGATTGFQSIMTNRNAMIQNTGFNATLTTNNIVSKDFSWTSSLNLSLNRNKLIRYEGLEKSTDANYLIVGKSLNILRMYKYIGVDPQTGYYSFMGADGKPTSNPKYETDRTVWRDNIFGYMGGFDNTFTYKSLSVSAFITFTKKNGINLQYGYFSPGVMRNQPVTVMNRWQKPGDIKPVQRFSAEDPIAAAARSALGDSDAYTRDASFARLRNVTATWTVPADLVKRAHLRSASIFMNASNLFTWSYYPLGDPETESLGGLNQMKTVVFGVSLGF